MKLECQLIQIAFMKQKCKHFTTRKIKNERPVPFEDLQFDCVFIQYRGLAHGSIRG